ncbi:hypothetical protein [Deinococcus planocerae]|nr:hypothetical protein [Deinococcus planocerae]
MGEAPVASHSRGVDGQVVDAARYDDPHTALDHAGLDETDALT